jgi:membrane protease YdiL (CAAX protease family)
VIFEIVATAILTALGGAITIAAAFWLAKKRGAKLSYEIGLNFGWEGVGKTVIFGFLGWGASLAILLPVENVASFVFRHAPSPANPAETLLLSTPMGFAAILLYVLVAIFAPITEEFVFRGLFFNAMRLRFGPPRAILLTGLAFGLMHPVGIAEQFGLCTLGAVFAWMAYRKQSLLPSMIAHSLQNSMAYAMLLFSMISVHTF